MRYFIFILLSFRTTLLLAQIEERKPVLIYTCGETPFVPDSCYLKYAARYSLAVKDLGCIINNKVKRKFNNNNRRANRKLSRRYGKDWEKKFKNDIESCRNNL